MSKKTETTSTAAYNPASMNAFNAFQPALQSGLMDYANNPAKMQNMWLQQAYKQIGLSANRMNSNTYANFNGMPGASPAFMASTLARNSRATSAMRSNAFLQTMFQSDANRKWALSGMAGYQPLQTGQTTTQKQSGLGTWLPQTLGAVAGITAAPFTGGMSLAATAKSAGGLFGGGGGLDPSYANNLANMGFNTVSRAPNPFTGDFWNKPQQ